MYAGIANSFAFLLLHARKCSLNSGSIPAAAASSSANSRYLRASSNEPDRNPPPPTPAPAAAANPRLFFDLRPTLGTDTGAANHDGITPHTSHALHRSHFGFSPKCEQIRMCRHSTSSTNRRTVL